MTGAFHPGDMRVARDNAFRVVRQGFIILVRFHPLARLCN
jgi:hypothetical protein